MPLPRRHGEQERLDAPAHEPRVLAQSLAHVAAVNRWLGGRRALRLALAPYLHDGARILDVGTGSADLPRALALNARRHGLHLHITATDAHPQMREIAARNVADLPGIDVKEADALSLPFPDDAFDVAVFSMVLHHLDDAQAVRALREGARVARIVVVNELHRTWINYAGARLLSVSVWRGNPLTRHDGPLSVLRAYRAEELAALAREAGLSLLQLRRRWFYRLVLVAGRA